MQNKRKALIIATAIFAVLVIAALTVYYVALPKPDNGTQNVTITIVYADKTEEPFTAKTDKAYLSDVLVELGLVNESEKTFFSTVNGITADYSVDSSYWSIRQNGIECTVGAGSLAITDGCEYEIVYTIFTME